MTRAQGKVAPRTLVVLLSLALLGLGIVELVIGYGVCSENPETGSSYRQGVCDAVGWLDLVAVLVLPAAFVFAALAFSRQRAAVLVAFGTALLLQMVILAVLVRAA